MQKPEERRLGGEDHRPPGNREFEESEAEVR
jgi:hypothetical protein